MNNYDADVFGFETRDRDIKLRQMLLAEAMKDRQPPPTGQMVSGHYVAPSIFQHLSTATGPMLRRMGMEALKREQAQLAQDDQRAGMQHVGRRPTGVQGTAQDDAAGNITGTQSRPPTLVETATWAQEGKSIPSRRQVMEKLLADQEINEPVRRQASLERNQDREDRQVEVRTTANATEQFRRDQLAEQKRAAEANTSAAAIRAQEAREDRRQRQADAAALRTLVATGQQSAAEDRRETIRLAAEGKSATETAARSKERQEIQSQLRDAQERNMLLDDALGASKTATGSGIGSVADKAASVFGWSTEGAKGAARLKALQAQLLTLTPKLGGATSDADVRNYREAVGQIGDDMLPIATREAAMETVRAVNDRDVSNAIRRRTDFDAAKPTAATARRGLPSGWKVETK